MAEEISRSDLEIVFKIFDADNSGEVDMKELKGLLMKVFKDDASKADPCAEFLMKTCDADKSGKLTMDEFCNGIMNFGKQ